MGRGARALCVSIPLLATAAAAALIVISTFIGQTNSKSSFLNKFYFIRLDTRYITAPEKFSIPGTTIDDKLANATGVNLPGVQNTAKLIGVDDFYQAGLFSYCSGTYDEATGSWDVTQCSKPSGSFVFNIINIINTQSSNQQTGNITFPDKVNDFFKGVSALTRAQYICFLFGIAGTGIEFVLGFFGLLSRWGSCVTTLVAVFSFLALLAASVINVALYATLTGVFQATFDTFGVHAAINRQTYILMYIGVLLSFGAMMFWMFTTCCCSGRRDKVMKSDGGASRGPKSYERVPSPYMGGAGPVHGGPAPAPFHAGYGQQQYGHTKSEAYEPMRHTAV